MRFTTTFIPSALVDWAVAETRFCSHVSARIAAARARKVPIVYMQEVHHPSLTDFGRELGFENGAIRLFLE